MNVAIIPARGGSKRIPRKNIRMFHGKPIIEYSIEAARASGLFDEIWVSSDDHEILRIATLRGVQAHRRPDGYDLEDVGTQEVTAECLRAIGTTAEYACCIYPTAPLMSVADLAYGHWTLEKYRGTRFALSVGTEPLCDAAQFYWGHTMAFILNELLIAPHTAMVPIDRKRVCDINTFEDFDRAERMYAALDA